jgi:hypothetical protein
MHEEGYVHQYILAPSVSEKEVVIYGDRVYIEAA